MSVHAVDVTAETFEQEVIEASRSVPVVVDFWAPWCAPCKLLKPVLEKLADEYAGKFKLAKLNTEENQEIASTFGIRSIPDVMAFKDGKPVSHFLGAVPESQVRSFIDTLIPSPSELERRRAVELRQAGDAEGAVEALRKAIALNAEHVPAQLDLAEMLIELKQVDEAQALLAAIRQHIDWDERVATLRTALTFARSASSGAGEAELLEKLAANPVDHDARFALASLRAGAKQYRPALDELLEIVRGDRNWNNGAARKQIIAIFNLAAQQPDLVSEYRKKLAGVLN